MDRARQRQASPKQDQGRERKKERKTERNIEKERKKQTNKQKTYKEKRRIKNHTLDGQSEEETGFTKTRPGARKKERKKD